jgi:hypothetical protein
MVEVRSQNSGKTKTNIAVVLDERYDSSTPQNAKPLGMRPLAKNQQLEVRGQHKENNLLPVCFPISFYRQS